MLLAPIERGCRILALKRFIFYSLKKERGGGMRERVKGEGGGASI